MAGQGPAADDADWRTPDWLALGALNGVRDRLPDEDYGAGFCPVVSDEAYDVGSRRQGLSGVIGPVPSERADAGGLAMVDKGPDAVARRVIHRKHDSAGFGHAVANQDSLPHRVRADREVADQADERFGNRHRRQADLDAFHGRVMPDGAP